MRGLLGLWSQEAAVEESVPSQPPGNPGLAAPGVLTSPLGPTFGLRPAQGERALAGGGRADYMGLTVSFHS